MTCCTCVYSVINLIWNKQYVFFILSFWASLIRILIFSSMVERTSSLTISSCAPSLRASITWTSSSELANDIFRWIKNELSTIGIDVQLLLASSISLSIACGVITKNFSCGLRLKSLLVNDFKKSELPEAVLSPSLPVLGLASFFLITLIFLSSSSFLVGYFILLGKWLQNCWLRQTVPRGLFWDWAGRGESCTRQRLFRRFHSTASSNRFLPGNCRCRRRTEWFLRCCFRASTSSTCFGLLATSRCCSSPVF